MSEYKDTLNLPYTNFPMKASLAQREPSMLSQWQQKDIYKKIRAIRAGSKRFVLHDGPPYANGHLHCGHALNKILKDFIIKSKTLSGFDAPFVPGWDCHGLPIELNVEKKSGKVGTKLNPAQFRAKCREYAATQIDIQRNEFQRLGVFGDWENPYTTMNFTYEANILRALGKIISNGHLHQGFKPVHWCVDCGSSLAEAEVDYEDKMSASIDVAFYAHASQAFLDIVQKEAAIKPVIVPIWTTTPWTLPANEAVCLNGELDYSLVDVGERYFLIADSLVVSVMARFGITGYSVINTVKGANFENLLLQHPFYDRLVPIILGSHVTIDSGTGCVHTAPAHGPDDYRVGLAYDLPRMNPVLANGCFAQEVALFAGLSVMKANPVIIDTLRERHALLHEETLNHSYPHCWRHKTPVIFRATPQWFISMDNQGLREQMIQQINTVDWVPEWGKARIYSMIATRPDWCVSRQRAWGTPMPLFIHKETRALHPNTVSLIDKVALLVEKAGIDAWFDLDITDVLGEDAIFYEKINDTLDVWFDSGISHFCVLAHHHDLQFPADVYFEGSDQHRGWFNSSLTTSVAINGIAPYKTVLTHGYTVDAEGKKLSKSKGNYIALDKVISQHGADILRLWVASTDYRNEVSISEEILKRTSDTYRRIRNTARFLLSNLFDFVPEKDMLCKEELVELDRWIIQQSQILQQAIVQAYEQYQFHAIYQKIHNFCAIDLGSFYLDIVKDRQYTTAVNSKARRSCQTAMYHLIQALTRWLAPLISFTAEEIWQAIPSVSSDSIFLEQWYDAWPEITDCLMNDWVLIQSVRDEVNKSLESARKTGLIGSGLAADVTIYADDTVQSILARLQDELRFIFITSSACVKSLSDCPSHIIVHDTLNIGVEVTASVADKCERCWHRRDDVGDNPAHPALCLRCVDNITGQDELRLFA